MTPSSHELHHLWFTSHDCGVLSPGSGRSPMRALKLDNFSLYVDSTEDIWLSCDACGQEIGESSGVWMKEQPALKTLDQFVARATVHRCPLLAQVSS